MMPYVKNRGVVLDILNSVDDLKIYRGNDYQINDFVTIKQPTLEQICDYGEKKYYNMIYTLCSVGADLKWQLDDIGIDYTTIDDFELFYTILARTYTMEQTHILFGNDIDFSKMHIIHSKELQENVMVQFYQQCPHCGYKRLFSGQQYDAEFKCKKCEEVLQTKFFQIDKFVYLSIVNVLRKIHKIKRNNEMPGNEATRQILIEDAREDFESKKDKPNKSYLLSLISSMVNSEGFKRNDITVFDMKIYAFMDSVARIGKIKNAELLLQSGYSGFGIDLKKINKEETNWIGDIN